MGLHRAKMPPVLAKLDAFPPRIPLLDSMLVTVYHKIFALGHNPAINDCAITWSTIARSRDGCLPRSTLAFRARVSPRTFGTRTSAHASLPAHELITWYADAHMWSYVARTHRLTQPLTQVRFPGSLRAINAIAFKNVPFHIWWRCTCRSGRNVWRRRVVTFQYFVETVRGSLVPLLNSELAETIVPAAMQTHKTPYVNAR